MSKMIIKAISIWEPYASLIRTGAKKIETRSWKTNYRGPLLICAAKNRLTKDELLNFLDDRYFQNGLYPLLGYSLDMNRKKRSSIVGIKHLNFGKAIAIVDLVECTPVEEITFGDFDYEALFGDFKKGNYAWKLGKVQAIKPFPVKGKQRLFDVKLPKRILNTE